MCYEASQLAYRIYKDAIRLKASPEEVAYLKEKWEQLKEGHQALYHASGHAHPTFTVFIEKDKTLELELCTWGLIPHWVKDEEQAKDLWNKTLNARGESLLEKPSFKQAAENGRCVIPLDGFFEHHHKNGKTFPHFIKHKDQRSLFVAGLRSNWINPVTGEESNTCTIVTTKGNELMSHIHNNPKLNEPRMPLVLDDVSARDWLHADTSIQELIQPYDKEELSAWTVKRLRGKMYVGNTEEAHKEHHYDEMNDPLTLF